MKLLKTTLLMLSLFLLCSTAVAQSLSGGALPQVPADNTAYDEATWDGSLSPATKDAIRDKIQEMVTSPTFSTSITVPIVYGSAASGGTLTLNSTSHATKGNIYLGSSSKLIFDEVNDRFGHGYAPTEDFMWAEPNGFNFVLESFDTGNTVTDAAALRIRKNANATMGQWGATADGEFLGRVIWEGVNLAANAWLPGVVMHARQEAPATNVGVPSRFCMDMYSSTSINSDVFCLNNSGSGGMNTAGVPRYVWDVRPTAGAGTLGISGDGSSDASIFFADNTTDEWEIKREETGNYFQIWESGVSAWLQITPATGAVAMAGSLDVTGTIDGETVVTLSTDPTVAVSASNAVYLNNDNDAIEFDLPADPTGCTLCFRNRYAAAITIDPNGTDVITMTDTAASAGEAIVSSGAVNEYICLVGVDTSNWIGLGKAGTWAEETP